MTESPQRQEGSERAKRRLSRRDYLGIALAAGLVGAVVGVTGAIGRANQDPYLLVIEETGADLIELPGFEQRFGSLEEDEAFDAGAQLGMAAVPNLADGDFSEYLGITRRLIGSLDPDLCASMALGTTDEERVLEALRMLELETVRRYAELLVAAARIELADGGGALPTPTEVQRAFDQLAAELGMVRLGEIGETFLDPTAAGDEVLCAAARDLYAALEALPPDATRAIFRSILAQAPAT